MVPNPKHVYWQLFLETFLSATLGTIFLLPFMAIAYFLNQIWRWILSQFLKYWYSGNLVLSAKGYDGMYMYKLPGGKRLVLYVAALEEPINLLQHRYNYEKHILSKPEYEKLKWRWIKKYGYFCLQQDTNFQIENHIRLYRENEVVTEDELMDKILPELSNDDDLESRDHPQWEDVIIPKFQYRNSSAAPKTLRIFRVHHGYMDGISNILMIAHTQSEGPEFPWVVDPLKASPGSSSALPKQLLLYSLTALNVVGCIVKNIVKDPRRLKHRWNIQKFTGETRFGWTNRIHMDVLRTVKKLTGSSMPGILCSILASAVRRYEEKYPDASFGPSEELIMGYVGAMLPYPDLRLRNHHSIIKCFLNCRPMSRMERLKQVNAEMMRLSKLPDIYLNHLLPTLYGEMPAWFSDACTALISGSGVVSNFPVSHRRVKSWGNEISDMAGYVPLLTQAGFGCVTLRYGDHLRFCVNSDGAMMSSEQLKFFLSAIEVEVDLLEEECVAMAMSASSSSDAVVDDQQWSIMKTDHDNNRIDFGNSCGGSDCEVAVASCCMRQRRLNAAVDKVMSAVQNLKKQ